MRQERDKPKRRRSGWEVLRWRGRTGSEPPEQLACPVCGAPVFESEEVLRPRLPSGDRTAASRACASCGAGLGPLLARAKKLRGSRRTLKFLWRGTLATFAGVLLCLAAALVLLSLQSPRMRIERPWFDPALDALKILVQVFFVACVLFKSGYRLLDGRIKRQSADLR
jgi:hypothetical protein